jgi:hypothetical protein
MAINYRVDCLPKQAAGTDYKVPCGMNTIIWRSAEAPNVLALTKLLAPMLNDGYIGLLSKWVGKRLTGEFVQVCIIHSTATE